MPQRLVIEPRNLYEINSTLGYKMRPHFDGEWRTLEYSTQIRTNAIGLRDLEIGPKPSNTFRILALGDSFTFSAGTELEDTYAKVLERLLAQSSMMKFEVINAGVEGYGPEHYLEYFKDVGVSLQPDVLTIGFYVANDLHDRISHKHYIHDGLLHSRKARFSVKYSVLYPINNLLEQRSHLFILMRTQLDYLLWQIGLRPYYFPHVFDKDYRKELAERWTFTKRTLEEIVRIASRHGARVAVIVIPTAYQVNQELWDDYMDVYAIDRQSVDWEKPQRILKRWGMARDIKVLDLLPRLREVARREDLYYKVDRHWNKNGNKVAGEEIYRFLKEEGLGPFR